ncbi:hypothetical protein FFI89_012900 [Bradyrhizobium sp. KBS0727]|nr:hypothetical protein FFI71_012895 [Bradyrhizobium sp. KBS0725]QDW44575.1 hypothetical protein FFI89_012900 [Bradyrhizobium sp. KBS0727]
MGSLSQCTWPCRTQFELYKERETGGFRLRHCFILAAAATLACSSALAQTPLSAYVDSNGFIDVQKLTCAQLAGTYQEDADALTSWYSGWYNGLAKKHYLDLRKGKVVEHEVIEYCKANPDKLIIEAIAVVFKDERAKLGIRMKAD